MKKNEKEIFISLLESIKDSNNAGIVPVLISEALVEVFGADSAQSIAHWAKYHTDRANA